MTPEETGRLWNIPGWPEHFGYLSRIPGPLRIPDLLGHVRTLGLPELVPPVEVSERVSFLAFPVLHRGERVGSIFLAEKEGGQEFTREDQEMLALFASQAALAIANARKHREEQRARNDLETLVDTSPVGVAVFDAATGLPRSFNREARRIVDSLRDPGQPVQDLLEVLTFRRADGRVVSLMEFPVAEALQSGETLRAEEVVISVPDGRGLTLLLNATPILSGEGVIESMVVTLQDMAEVKELERLRAEFLAMVSHELRIPLSSIKGSATTILDSVGGPGPGGGAPVRPHHARPGRPHERPGVRSAGRGPHRDGGAFGQPRTGGGGGAGGPGQERLQERGREKQPRYRRGPGPAPGVGGPAAHRPGAGEPADQRGPPLPGVVGVPGQRRRGRAFTSP